MILLLLLLGFARAEAQEEPIFVNRMVTEAEKSMNSYLQTPFAEQKTEGDRHNFSKAILAKTALLRLQGREAEAVKVLEKCDQKCQKYGSAEEWTGVRDWACAKSVKSFSCPEKAKTRKPPQ
jgi:hypothetical protein